MSLATEQLSDLLEERLRGATLQPPRFEQLSSLRFELGGRHRTHSLLSRRRSANRFARRRRVNQAIARACVLFEEAFPASDSGFLAAYIWAPIEVGRHRLLDLVPAAVRVGVERDEGVNFWGDREGGDRFISLVVGLRPRELDYLRLFELIAGSDLGVGPGLNAKVYVLNESDPVIFHMYDDRGAILHAPTKDRLDRIRAAHPGWLVPKLREG